MYQRQTPVPYTGFPQYYLHFLGTLGHHLLHFLIQYLHLLHYYVGLITTRSPSYYLPSPKFSGLPIRLNLCSHPDHHTLPLLVLPRPHLPPRPLHLLHLPFLLPLSTPYPLILLILADLSSPLLYFPSLYFLTPLFRKYCLGRS